MQHSHQSDAWSMPKEKRYISSFPHPVESAKKSAPQLITSLTQATTESLSLSRDLLRITVSQRTYEIRISHMDQDQETTPCQTTQKTAQSTLWAGELHTTRSRWQHTQGPEITTPRKPTCLTPTQWEADQTIISTRSSQVRAITKLRTIMSRSKALGWARTFETLLWT